MAEGESEKRGEKVIYSFIFALVPRPPLAVSLPENHSLSFAYISLVVGK